MPCSFNPLLALGADAIDRLQFGGTVLDDAQNFSSEPSDQLLCQDWSDPLHQAAAEVTLNPFGCGGRYDLHHRRFKLQPVLFVSDPSTFGNEPFSGGHRRQRSDNGRLFSVPLCLDAEDAKTAFLIVEGDALDQAGDFFGHGFALRCCSTHLVGALFSHG